MFKKIGYFFKELFKNDVGEYNPNADKVDAKSVLYWVIGLLISFIIPMCLVYLEVGEFDWNVFKFIWGEEAQALYGKGLYRGGYFIGGFCANVSFLMMGFLTTYRINGKRELLAYKQSSRWFFVLCFFLAVSCFVFACIYY